MLRCASVVGLRFGNADPSPSGLSSHRFRDRSPPQLLLFQSVCQGRRSSSRTHPDATSGTRYADAITKVPKHTVTCGTNLRSISRAPVIAHLRIYTRLSPPLLGATSRHASHGIVCSVASPLQYYGEALQSLTRNEESVGNKIVSSLCTHARTRREQREKRRQGSLIHFPSTYLRTCCVCLSRGRPDANDKLHLFALTPRPASYAALSDRPDLPLRSAR